MVLPATALIAPPTEVLNENVAATPAFAATRSEPDIKNEGLRTRSPIAPDDTEFDKLSTFVRTVIAPPAVGALPIVNPVNVIVTAFPFPMLPEILFMTTEVGVGAPEVQEPLDDKTAGVEVVAKKTVG